KTPATLWLHDSAESSRPQVLHEICMVRRHSCTVSARRLADHQIMEADLDRSVMLRRGQHSPRKATLEDRLIARMLAPWLDRELADCALANRGLANRRGLSEAHAARAEQLMSEHTRTSLARTLDRLVEGAESARPPSRLAGIPPCRDQVQEAVP